jgi:predicted helicase
VNENDNNKNRRYPVVDHRIAETYSKDSLATSKTALADPYVKAIRWASDRLGAEGVVAFVTNSGFLDAVATDGMRKHLARDFESIFILDLGGNVRKNPKLSGTTHNVFGIQIGVSINLLVRSRTAPSRRLQRLLRENRRVLEERAEVCIPRASHRQERRDLAGNSAAAQFALDSWIAGQRIWRVPACRDL